MEPQSAGLALARGARHVLSLLTPYLADGSQKAHLQQLTAAYQPVP
jgi:hypothetical protein